jgi:alpha-tubulin suppressor-like RCC1 family protein
LDDGSVWAWGQNNRGQLGYPPPAWDERGDTSIGSPVQVPYLSGIVAIAAGDQHNLALDATGTAWAWADNRWGQLGNGHPNPTMRPILLPVTGVG